MKALWSLKCQEPLVWHCSVSSQQTWTLSNTTVKISNLMMLQTLGFSPGDREHLDNFLVLAFQRNLPPQFNLLNTSGLTNHHRTRTSKYKTCHRRFYMWRNDINFVLWENQKYKYYVCAVYDCRSIIAVLQKYILSARTQLYVYVDVLNMANIESWEVSSSLHGV